MPNVEIQYVLLGGLAIALAIAAITDIRRRQIDNWLNAGVALTAPVWWWASALSLWPDVAWQLGLAALTFTVCAGLFALRAMGGGDVKLLAALALWIAPAWFLKLIVMMSLLGGLLAVVLAFWHGARRRRERLAIPYGVAISTAGLWVLASQYLLTAAADGLGSTGF
jgi:prepilin peptidase CpaA